MDWNKNYIEWCEIMEQKPNERDQIIFMAGFTFCSINQNTTSNSDYTECPKCGSTNWSQATKLEDDCLDCGHRFKHFT